MSAAAVVLSMIDRRCDGPDRELLKCMLFGDTTRAPRPMNPRAGLPLTAEQKDSIRAYAGTGISHVEIAKEVGVSRQAVSGVLSRCGARA